MVQVRETVRMQETAKKTTTEPFTDIRIDRLIELLNVTVNEPLVEERVAAFDCECSCVFSRNNGEVGLIKLTIDGPEATVERHFHSTTRDNPTIATTAAARRR